MCNDFMSKSSRLYCVGLNHLRVLHADSDVHCIDHDFYFTRCDTTSSHCLHKDLNVFLLQTMAASLLLSPLPDERKKERKELLFIMPIETGQKRKHPNGRT